MAPLVDESGRRGLPAWRRHTASGVLLTAMALGLREALDEPKREAQVEVEDAGDPFPDPEPLELHFDPAGPAHTWVVVRPWLLEAGRS